LKASRNVLEAVIVWQGAGVACVEVEMALELPLSGVYPACLMRVSGDFGDDEIASVA